MRRECEDKDAQAFETVTTKLLCVQLCTPDCQPRCVPCPCTHITTYPVLSCVCWFISSYVRPKQG